MVRREHVREALEQSVQESLENLVYLAVESSDAQCGHAAPDDVWAWLEITAPVQGKALIESSAGLIHSLAAFIFPSDSGATPDPAVLKDVCAEMVNTLSGRFMAKVLTEAGEFSLGLPHSGFGTAPELGKAAVQLHFRAEQLCFRVSLFGEAFRTD